MTPSSPSPSSNGGSGVNLVELENIKTPTSLQTSKYPRPPQSDTQKGSSVVDEEGNLKHELTKNRPRQLLIGMTLGVILAMIALVFVTPILVVVVYSLEQQRLTAVQQQAKQVALTADLSIRKQVEVSFSTLVLMEQVLSEWNYTIDLAKYNSMCAKLSKRYIEMDAFEIARYENGEFPLKFIYPPFPQLIDVVKMGYNTPQHLSLIQDAINKNDITIFGPTNLVEGTVSSIGQFPIFFPNGSLYGLSVGVFRFDKMFDAINLHATLKGYQYQLYDYNLNRFFLQSLSGDNDTEPLIGKNATTLQDSLQLNMTVMNNVWRISLRPVNGWDSGSLLWLEILIAVLVGIVVFVLVVLATNQLVQDYFRKKDYKYIQEKLEIKVKDRTKELANSHTQLTILLDRISAEEQRTKKIINSLDDSLLTVSAEGKILHCNSAFYKTFGFNDTDVLGGKVVIRSVLPTLDVQKEMANSRISLALQEDAPNIGRELKAINKMGIEMNVRISMSFSRLFTVDSKSATKTESSMTNVVVILIQALNDKNMLKELREKEIMYNNLKERIHFQEMFDNIDKRGRFKEFCAKEMNDEWILFLEDVYYYKSLTNIQERVNLQTEIYEKFIKIGSKQQLNISKEELQLHSYKIQRFMGEIELFDELEKVAIQNLLFDAFKRWQDKEKINEANTQFL